MYFCSCGWPTRPRTALAKECPIRGTVPRKSGAKFFAAASRRISKTGFSLPVCLRKARCCFSTMRTGLIKGALRMDATVAATYPGSASPLSAVYPSSTPNLGIRLMRTPNKRGLSPDRDAAMGERAKTAFASARATAGSTALPLASFAYCCTSCR